MKLHQGSIILTVVLVLAIVSLSITTSIALLSINTAETSFALSKGYEALALAEGCAEDTLLLARSNGTYSGGSLSRPEGTCTITVSKSGNQWTASITANGEYQRTIQVIFNRLGSGISLISWKNTQ